jgi:hypothetical protein
MHPSHALPLLQGGWRVLADLEEDAVREDEEHRTVKALGEALAGAVVALMTTGGAALEAFAVERAARDLRAFNSSTYSSVYWLNTFEDVGRHYCF